MDYLYYMFYPANINFNKDLPENTILNRAFSVTFPQPSTPVTTQPTTTQPEIPEVNPPQTPLNPLPTPTRPEDPKVKPKYYVCNALRGSCEETRDDIGFSDRDECNKHCIDKDTEEPSSPDTDYPDTGPPEIKAPTSSNKIGIIILFLFFIAMIILGAASFFQNFKTVHIQTDF